MDFLFGEEKGNFDLKNHMKQKWQEKFR